MSLNAISMAWLRLSRALSCRSVCLMRASRVDTIICASARSRQFTYRPLSLAPAHESAGDCVRVYRRRARFIFIISTRLIVHEYHKLFIIRIVLCAQRKPCGIFANAAAMATTAARSEMNNNDNTPPIGHAYASERGINATARKIDSASLWPTALRANMRARARKRRRFACKQ